MEKNCCKCIWGEKCGEGDKNCDDFSPFDDSTDRESYYLETVKERCDEYLDIIEEYK